MSEPAHEVEIPARVLVRCPMRSFDQRFASHCEGCEHFAGLTDLFPGSAYAFQRRYAVRCRWPVDRELSSLASD